MNLLLLPWLLKSEGKQPENFRGYELVLTIDYSGNVEICSSFPGFEICILEDKYFGGSERKCMRKLDSGVMRVAASSV